MSAQGFELQVIRFNVREHKSGNSGTRYSHSLLELSSVLVRRVRGPRDFSSLPQLLQLTWANRSLSLEVALPSAHLSVSDIQNISLYIEQLWAPAGTLIWHLDVVF